jgi:hypothetical protein
MLVSTVDVVRGGGFRALRGAGPARGATVLAVTLSSSDEKPLWVTLGAGGRVRGSAGG